MADELQQHEEIARPAGQRRSGQQLHGERRRRGRGARRQLARELAARAGVVLQVVRFVEHQRRPRHAQEAVDVPAEDVVVDDDPLGGRGDRRAALDHQDGGVRRDDADLTRPVALDGGRADDQPGPAGREVPQRDDRLARLAEAHVVGEDRAPPAEQERDAFDLVREQAFGQRDGAPERRVGIARQLEQLRECRGLRVERVGHAQPRWSGARCTRLTPFQGHDMDRATTIDNRGWPWQTAAFCLSATSPREPQVDGTQVSSRTVAELTRRELRLRNRRDCRGADRARDAAGPAARRDDGRLQRAEERPYSPAPSAASAFSPRCGGTARRPWRSSSGGTPKVPQGRTILNSWAAAGRVRWRGSTATAIPITTPAPRRRRRMSRTSSAPTTCCAGAVASRSSSVSDAA